MEIKIKRVYEISRQNDGFRILVDRLWPRGVSKENAKIDFWPKDLAPSNDLRHWYNHDQTKWAEFKLRYFAELQTKAELFAELMTYINRGPVIFIFSSKERHLNNATALKEYIESNTT